MVKALRRAGKQLVFSVLERALQSDDGRAIVNRVLCGHLHRLALPDVPFEDLSQVYPELPLRHQLTATGVRSPVFVTGRFRSGSTLLWNIFRNMPGVTAYYEPFNERRWFDPVIRGERIDGTHRGVTNYWKEYGGLGELASLYDERWTERELYMDEHSWNPRMEKYVRILVERAQGRAVLQFNRIDFRLGWFRRVFPDAILVHIVRHPRDQWCSSLESLEEFRREGRMEDFAAADHFYLRRWARDLKYHFPFLEEADARHPYEIFYYLWKLSYLFAKKYCDYSTPFERLVTQPRSELPSLFHAVRMEGVEIGRVIPLIDPPELGRWRRYAEESWFRGIEARCEEAMARFSGPAYATTQ